MIYEYRIGKNKRLGYNTDGFFDCPDVVTERKLAEAKKERYFVDRTKHKECFKSGENCFQEVERKIETTPDGKEMTIVKTLKWSVDKKNPPICRCGKEMIWMGYPVWYKYVDPRAKMIGGLFRMGNKDKIYWTKHFRTRKAREKFIARFLTKHKT